MTRDQSKSNPVASTVKERLVAWRELDKAAIQAEQEADRIGQGTTDEHVRFLVLKAAKQLRVESDREFGAILRDT
jgi:hypothetical protein